MRRATQALALLLPVPAAVAAWALWQRVAAYGWTPDRLAGAVAAALALAYGLLYAGSVLSGRAWMARIRAGNIGMALVLLVTAALWQTPLFDPTRIAAHDQLARVLDGRTELPDLDPYAIGRWGRAGSEALEALQQRASEPGQGGAGRPAGPAGCAGADAGQRGSGGRARHPDGGAPPGQGGHARGRRGPPRARRAQGLARRLPHRAARRPPGLRDDRGRLPHRPSGRGRRWC